MKRRVFLSGLIAAPAVIAYAKLMPVRAFAEPLVLYGDGIADDTAALNAFLRGDPVRAIHAVIKGRTLTGGFFNVSNGLHVSRDAKIVGSSIRYFDDGSTFIHADGANLTLRDSTIHVQKVPGGAYWMDSIDKRVYA